MINLPVVLNPVIIGKFHSTFNSIILFQFFSSRPNDIYYFVFLFFFLDDIRFLLLFPQFFLLSIMTFIRTFPKKFISFFVVFSFKKKIQHHLQQLLVLKQLVQVKDGQLVVQQLSYWEIIFSMAYKLFLVMLPFGVR